MGAVNEKNVEQLMGALCVLLLASQAWAGAGAYSSTAVGPTIYTKGYYYYANFPPVGSIPPGSIIGGPGVIPNAVSWSWSTSYTPPGLVTYLCYNSSLTYCLQLTSQSGSTSVFNNKPAGNTFVFAQGVAGSGALYPVMYGNMDQVIVNFSY